MAFSTYFEIFVLIVAAIVLCCESAQEKVKIPAFDSTIRPAKCADGWRGEACEINTKWDKNDLEEYIKVASAAMKAQHPNLSPDEVKDMEQSWEEYRKKYDF